MTETKHNKGWYLASLNLPILIEAIIAANIQRIKIEDILKVKSIKL